MSFKSLNLSVHFSSYHFRSCKVSLTVQELLQNGNPVYHHIGISVYHGGRNSVYRFQELKNSGPKALHSFYEREIFKFSELNKSYNYIFICIVERKTGVIIRDAVSLQKATDIPSLENLKLSVLLSNQFRYINHLESALLKRKSFNELYKLTPDIFNLPTEWKTPHIIFNEEEEEIFGYRYINNVYTSILEAIANLYFLRLDEGYEMELYKSLIFTSEELKKLSNTLGIPIIVINDAYCLMKREKYNIHFQINEYSENEKDRNSFLFCDNCGQKLPRVANYCLHCGFDLTQNNQEDPESDEEFDNHYDNHHENGKKIEVIPKKSDTKSKKWRPEVSILIFIISFLLIFIATSERDPEGAIVNGLVGGFFWTLVLTYFFGYKK